MKKLILSFCLSFLAVSVFAQDEEQEKEIVTTDLLEVVVVGDGVIDLAKDRVTPVAVSTITAEEFELKGVGNVEFAETLRMVPGVFVTATSGGFGEAEVFTRGFNQANTALLLNGQPINAVEDGLVYWSNWSGMSDVAQQVQVQRGLGSSKLAISSVGGTVNIVTKTTEARQGGYLRQLVGSNEYYKTSFAYNTGLMDSGLSFSMLLDHWQGAKKWAKWTQGQGQIYFFSVGYKPNANHNFNMLFTGAPQWHHQNFDQSLEYYEEYGIDANQNGGLYQGEEHSERRNFYHKPVANFTWDWDINDNLDLSTVIYGSWGRGGGTGGVGRGRVRLDNREIDFDAIQTNNIASADASGYGNFGDSYARRASMNIHDWYGVISNLNVDNGGDITYNVGFDYRTYTGTHFRQIVDLYGLNGYTDNFRNSRPDDYTITETYDADPWAAFFGDYATPDQRYDRDYSETINYFGGFGQAEYANDSFSAFVQASVSSQTMQRDGRMTGYGDGLGKSTKLTFDGYNLKGGVSYVVGDNGRVFANAGFYSRQPFFESVIDDSRYSNAWVNDGDVDNEEILGFEAGYRYETNKVRFMLDLYSTEWGNRYVAFSETDPDDNNLYYRLYDVTQKHNGIEFQLDYKIDNTSNVSVIGSFGDWNYSGTTPYKLEITDADTQVQTTTDGSLDVNEVKVGQAPQTSFGVSFDTKVSNKIYADARINFYYDLFGFIDVEDVLNSSLGGSTYQAEELDDYNVMDLGITYKFNLGDNNARLRANVYNLFDNEYISSRRQYGYSYGNPRSFNVSLKYMF